MSRRHNHRRPVEKERRRDYTPDQDFKEVEADVGGWVELLEKMVTALFEYCVVLLKTACSCIIIIANNPLGGAVLFFLFLWWLFK